MALTIDLPSIETSQPADRPHASSQARGGSSSWTATVPVFNDFKHAVDSSKYVPLPDDWCLGISDVVNSTDAIENGLYKAVNLAGAGTISGVINALNGELALFAFGGDGAHFAVSPVHAAAAADALSRVAMWAQRELNLNLRVGMTNVAAVRAAGFDVRVALWQASENVRYALFTGGGMEWAEEQLKGGKIELGPASAENEPDLTGLSCQWGPVLPKNGKIVSLIVKPQPSASAKDFSRIGSQVMGVVEKAGALNPLPAAGPDVRWPSAAMGLQSRIAFKGYSCWRRRLRALWKTSLIWLVFKLGIRIGKYSPNRYRREIAENTDYRKFDDALMMTIDCAPSTVDRLRKILEQATANGLVRYGLHMQDKALITCVVPSPFASDHMHFIDGAGGGYALAARRLKE
jgi:hypothetical protein